MNADCVTSVTFFRIGAGGPVDRLRIGRQDLAPWPDTGLCGHHRRWRAGAMLLLFVGDGRDHSDRCVPTPTSVVVAMHPHEHSQAGDGAGR